MALLDKTLRISPNKWGFLPHVIAAIILGIVCGTFFPDWITRIFVTFNELFEQFLGFIIPLLIVGLIAPGIAELGREAGKMLIATILLAYGFTLFAGFFAYGAAALSYPWLLSSESALVAFESASELAPYVTLPLTPIMNVTSSLVLAFVLGLGMAFCEGQTLKKMMFDFRFIIYKVISRIIIPLLPLYIFGVFLGMTATEQVVPVVEAFAKVIVLLFILTLIMVLLQFLVAGTVAKRNPLKMLRVMLPAYFTALGTSSSAATIPVTYNQVQALGVREGVAGFTVPLCANIHMTGSTIEIVACALAIIFMTGGQVEFWQFSGFICMLGISIVAGPGVPGGAIMAALGVLQQMLGFNEQMLGLMIALCMAMDSFGTACNVTGDGAIAIIIDKLYPEKNNYL